MTVFIGSEEQLGERLAAYQIIAGTQKEALAPLAPFIRSLEDLKSGRIDLVPVSVSRAKPARRFNNAATERRRAWFMRPACNGLRIRHEIKYITRGVRASRPPT